MSASDSDIHDRLRAVEKDVGQLQTDVGVLKRDMHDTRGDVGKILRGVEDLQKKDLARPPPTNVRAMLVSAVATFVSIMAAIGMLAAFSWWFTAQSPAVQGLERRLNKLDDADIGRVTDLGKRQEKLEGRLQRLEDWRPRAAPTN